LRGETKRCVREGDAFEKKENGDGVANVVGQFGSLGDSFWSFQQQTFVFFSKHQKD
jgi:hypothetical protein